MVGVPPPTTPAVPSARSRFGKRGGVYVCSTWNIAPLTTAWLCYTIIEQIDYCNNVALTYFDAKQIKMLALLVSHRWRK